MPCNGWLLIYAPDGLRLGRVDGETMLHGLATSADAEPDEIASVVRQHLDEHGYRGEPVVVGVASQMCLAVAVPHTGRRMTRNRQSMVYALEEFLPVAAEDIVCDFVVFDNDAFGVAVEVSTLRSVLSALEEAAVPVASIVPTAVLVLQHLVGESRPREREIVCWQDGDSLEFFELVNGKPHAWKTFPASTTSLTRELRFMQVTTESPPVARLTAYNLSGPLLDAARRTVVDVVVAAEEASVDSAAAKSAAAGLRAQHAPWIELCRDQFGSYDPYRPIRGRVRLFAVMAACLLFSLGLATWIRADKYQDLARRRHHEQEATFRRVFPASRVPVGIRSRLQSEYQKLAGLTGSAGNMPQLQSATLLLRDALAPLPEDLRYRLLEIRAEGNRVFFDGELRRHGDADLLATALRSGAFKVDAPHTEQLADKGVAVTITATRSNEDDAIEQGPR